mgnify:FL=1
MPFMRCLWIIHALDIKFVMPFMRCLRIIHALDIRFVMMFDESFMDYSCS